MSIYIRLLKEVKATDTGVVGGKAANLAKLVQADIPVPDGFAVGLSAFDNNGLLTQEAKQQIEKLINKSKLYAVRSSALAEDAKSASWAGQFETFLDTKPQEVISKIEQCHNSTKNRAQSYAEDKNSKDFNIAVVVQEMLKPDYAGVLFTKDPITGNDQLITEFVEGLGEELVSGRADPKRITLKPNVKTNAPFDTAQLVELANKTEKLFGVPQDIEWVWANNKMWLVQARPITATQEERKGYDLGEPDELFYWGPSRAKPMYMSDFMTAIQHFFTDMASNTKLPNPPKTIALFNNGQNVWLINANEFGKFTEETFVSYEKQKRLESDAAKWGEIATKLPELKGKDFSNKLIEAWSRTLFAEFALYGAETVLIKRLSRFDAQKRQDIWGAFTVPDKPTFLARIDSELAQSNNPQAMADKYPWIQDGYDGVSLVNAKEYFEKRLKIVKDEKPVSKENKIKRETLIKKLNLTDDEVSALSLARKLAEFMDDRKAWMMQTRRLLKNPIGNIKHGWFFDNGNVSLIDEANTREIWQRYIDFKAATSAVVGIVASNGSKHYVNGDVAVVTSPTDAIDDNMIVVVPSTSPSYVPLMRKAKALITDHGGMMSHAAIVAREFNLPCIVGTKQATKLLNNGDKVVLDLVKGEVNKL